MVDRCLLFSLFLLLLLLLPFRLFIHFCLKVFFLPTGWEEGGGFSLKETVRVREGGRKEEREREKEREATGVSNKTREGFV